ncbi:hypothetical protein OROGR_012557 [Orobanche gracilis]
MMISVVAFSIICVLMESTMGAAAMGKGDWISELWSRAEMVKLAGYGEDKLSRVVISGRLLCYAGFTDDKIPFYLYPVSGATVAVLCGTRLVKGSTDNYGEFLIDLPSHFHAIPNLEKRCLVQVFHTPESCRQDFTGKHKRIELTSKREGVRIYTTNDIHLMAKRSEEHSRKGGKTQYTMPVSP